MDRIMVNLKKACCIVCLLGALIPLQGCEDRSIASDEQVEIEDEFSEDLDYSNEDSDVLDYNDSDIYEVDDSEEMEAASLPDDLPSEDVSITDETFDSGVRGMASLYSDTSKEIPIWFEGDLDDVYFAFMIDNIGTSYASIKHTKLVVDDFEPLSMDDILLLSEEAFAGVPTEVEASVDLINISPKHSEYDVNFYVYNDYDEGVEIKLRKGQTFNVNQISQTRFIIYPKLVKSGMYTYHLKVDFEYNRTEYSMETEPISFIYMAGNSDNYKYDNTELTSLHLDKEFYSDEYDMFIYYTIEGRTLIIHDTSTITDQNDFGKYFSLIDTIRVEDATKRIEAYAFGTEPGLYNVEKVYLPKSLEYLDVDCFYFNLGKLKTIYFGGTEEQWDSLIANSESDRVENIENVEIIYNYAY